MDGRVVVRAREVEGGLVDVVVDFGSKVNLLALCALVAGRVAVRARVDLVDFGS